MAMSERYWRILNAAQVVEERVRRALIGRFDGRAGVVDDSPVYGASPGWLEDPL